MAKARVDLVEGLSLMLNGRTYVKGKPQIITNVNEIHSAKMSGSLCVTMLSEDPALPVSVDEHESKVEPEATKKSEVSPAPAVQKTKPNRRKPLKRKKMKQE